MDFIEIEILNWEKYNPRKDYKRPWWFALSNTITSDDIFSEFSDAEFKAWIHILCTASVQNSYRPQLFFKKIESACGIKKKSLIGAVQKLETLGVIKIPNGICTGSVQDLYATLHNRTIQNNTIQNNIAQSDDFADFWSEYPKKKGKTEAEKKYRAAIKAGAAHEEICRARDKYREQLGREGTDAKFILHGSTFMGRYKEFLDPDFGTTESFATPLTDAEAKERALFEQEGA